MANVTRREFVALGCAAGGALPAAAQPGTGPASRANVLFIMTDELRFDCVGYQNSLVRTPNLDRLAQSSVVFSRAYSTSPSCVPARAAIYTGRYPMQCGAPTYITYLPNHETTFMARLRQAGYHTAAIGKQHFGKSGIDRGYDYEDIIDFATAGEGSYRKFLEESGMQGRRLSSPVGRFAHRWDVEQRFHVDDFIGEQGRRWITGKRPAGKPWFLTVSFMGPHQPFDGLGLPFERQYSLGAINLPHTSSADLAGKPPHFRQMQQQFGGLTEQEIRQVRLSYYSKISMIDSKIGAILDALKASGEYDRTIIVFTADHGDYMGDYGLIYKGQYLSEALMRVPMLVKPPLANFQGRSESAFVSNFDIAATSLAAAELPIPPQLAAQDLSKFWKSPATAARRTHAFMDAQSLQGIRDDRWKLVHYRDREYGELYDLQVDPWETQNLWNDRSAREVKANLQNHLVDHLIRIAPNSHSEWNTGAPTI
ncbi:MAG: sulfatase-like hydrolase/transferase [Acidobacteria bacterium]|nr:sulfatase-like hydrolase/transferase [Acidobacteriota bacterium]